MEVAVLKIKWAGWLVFLGLLWTGCSQIPVTPAAATEPRFTVELTPTILNPEQTPTPAALPAAVDLARKALAGELGVGQSEIKVVSFEQVDWPDSCLGAPKPNEDCATVVTPGYRILLAGGGKTIEMHTNQSGTDLRKPQPVGSDQDSSVKAVTLLARLAGLKEIETRVSRMEQRDWPDACLGVPQVGEVCAAVITPGYYFELQNGDQVYWLHTNQAISDGRVAGPQTTLIGMRVRLKAAQIAGLPVEDLKVSSVESMEWPNSCLGINTPGLICLDVITPGYRVVLMDNERKLVFHTDRDANSVVIEK